MPPNPYAPWKNPKFAFLFCASSMVELLNPKPLENPKMSIPTSDSARVFENAMIVLPNIVILNPMSNALLSPSLLRYIPTNIFDSTVPTSENSGINEEMPTDML